MKIHPKLYFITIIIKKLLLHTILLWINLEIFFSKYRKLKLIIKKGKLRFMGKC